MSQPVVFRRDDPFGSDRDGASHGSDPRVADPVSFPARPARAAVDADASGQPLDEWVLRHLAKTNPLMGAAVPLLTLTCQLRGTLRNDDAMRLLQLVAEELKAFEGRALRADAVPQDVAAARYLLCALIDETVLSTPWGANGPWAEQPLLSSFHPAGTHETARAARLAAIVETIRAKPARYLHLLELIDVALTLGLRGGLDDDGGPQQLERLRQELWGVIRKQRGAVSRKLAPPPNPERRRAQRRLVPIWIAYAAAAGIALLLYGGLHAALEHDLTQAAHALDQVDAAP